MEGEAYRTASSRSRAGALELGKNWQETCGETEHGFGP